MFTHGFEKVAKEKRKEGAMEKVHRRARNGALAMIPVTLGLAHLFKGKSREAIQTAKMFHKASKRARGYRKGFGLGAAGPELADARTYRRFAKVFGAMGGVNAVSVVGNEHYRRKLKKD